MWPKETPDAYCANNTNDGNVYDQQAPCQALCEADSGCVGFVWSLEVSSNSHCYLCQSDSLGKSGKGYGFYRKPGNNELYMIKCFIGNNFVFL